MIKSILTALMFFLATCLRAQEPSTATNPLLYTKEQLLEDFDSLHQWIRQTHPQLYFHSDSLATEKRWKRERQKINQPLPAESFEKIISPLTAQYNDGHLYIDVNFDELSSKGNCLFPVRVIIKEDKIYALDSIGFYPPGISIRAVNGIKTTSILKTIIDAVPGDHQANKEATASRLFPYYFGKYAGYTNRYTITVSKKQVITVNAVGLASYMKQLFPQPVWSMQLYKEEQLAVITCKNYEGKLATVHKTLDSFFTIIKKEAIQHVALDLRHNGGGNSAIGTAFLSYVTDKPVSGIAAKIYRQSPLLLQLKDDEWPKSQFMEATKSWQQKGEWFEKASGPETVPELKDKSLRFSGKFYLFTSARTYSSAHITALQVRCSGLGTIIGQPTGEDVNLTGEVIGAGLPHTKLFFNCPVAMYRPACDHTQRNGLEPDIWVPFSKEQGVSDQDAETETLRRIIRSGNQQPFTDKR